MTDTPAVTDAPESRIAEFGLAVALDTDLRKLHEQGRISDALRLIQWALDRQRNEGIEAAAVVADTLANLVIEADRIGALDRKHGYCADTARHIAKLARNLKEPE